MSSTRPIKIFDTTLRDGEQSPGCSMHLSDKLQLAHQLERLGVDIIEAGFAAASLGDFESVKTIASNIKNAQVASLARANKGDIDKAYEALKCGVSPRIHTFIATSPIHMAYKLKKRPEEVIQTIQEMVTYAHRFISDIEFSAEDATRSDLDFLARAIDTAILAGASTINIPDTVGYTSPVEFNKFLRQLYEKSTHLHKVILSVHCHNDLGMAVANSLSALSVGAGQIECTINGIGERAGNAALEEVVMALHTRQDAFGVRTGIQTQEIYKTSRLLSHITGVGVSPTKPIIGANAFSHESGIHQHGMLAHPTTYEIMTPESIGLTKSHMVLGKHSGKHGFKDHLATLGFHLQEEALNTAFEAFKRLADKKKEIYDEDLLTLVLNPKNESLTEFFVLEGFVIHTSTTTAATATLHLKDASGAVFSDVSLGDGPVDAAYKAIDKILSSHPECERDVYTLETYGIRAVTEGNDAQGEATVKLLHHTRSATGIGMSTDILEASILAYLNGINKHLNWKTFENGGSK